MCNVSRSLQRVESRGRWPSACKMYSPVTQPCGDCILGSYHVKSRCPKLYISKLSVSFHPTVIVRQYLNYLTGIMGTRRAGVEVGLVLSSPARLRRDKTRRRCAPVFHCLRPHLYGTCALSRFPLLMFVHKVLNRIVLPDFEFEVYADPLFLLPLPLPFSVSPLPPSLFLTEL
jgi:hypothetical protein